MDKVLISGLAVIIASSHLVSSAGVPLIIDTDASFDVDDVVAVCMAHALMDRGEVDIKAIVHDAGIPEGIGAMSVLNHYYGHDDILLGAYKVMKRLPVSKYYQSYITLCLTGRLREGSQRRRLGERLVC